jgi:outer membrane receptor protein involved in Fe transport
MLRSRSWLLGITIFAALLLSASHVLACQEAADAQKQSALAEKAKASHPGTLPHPEETIIVTAESADPAIDRRNDTVYKNTLFLRDDQLFDTLDGGINAGQHEGGGKSIEVRRFGFNLDHGGANGGLKVLVDDVPQNQATQAHGQGYLGALKSLSPELVEDVDIVNGPFNAEYGDFSALGVVHIRLKDALDSRWTLRAQGGSFNGYRSFAAWSPRTQSARGMLAWEHAYTDGPFLNPLRYVRDNLTANAIWQKDARHSFAVRANGARNDFDSSGQIPLDLVYSGALDRFGYMDPSDGGHVRSGTASVHFKDDVSAATTLRADGWAGRSLFDLFSNFTFYLNDPKRGDGLQQHDSRLQEGGTVQVLHAANWLGMPAMLSAGGNVADSWVNVDLFHAENSRVIAPVDGIPQTETNVHITNPAAYVQAGVERGRVHADAALRVDLFRFALTDRLNPGEGGAFRAVSPEPKANLLFRPSMKVPVALHANYGRAVTSEDARGMALNQNSPRTAATDFTMLGASLNEARVSASADAFLIDRQHESVYDADNGTLQYQGPSRSYGWEMKTSVQVTRKLSWNAGLTQVSNAFFRGTAPREYVDSAPHSVANASLTLNGWRGLYSSLRYRHVSHYLVINSDETPAPPAQPFASGTHAEASGLDVLDFAATKKLEHGLEFNLSVDNLNDKRYFETQNYFNSRIAPAAPVQARLHGTPGYPAGVEVGLTWRFE